MTKPTTPQQWLLLQTKPREELRALEQLQNQNCQAYCPQIPIEKITRGKRTTNLEPLFPGYIFIQNPDTQQASALTYTSIRSTRGVSKIVRFGSDYTLLPDELIQQIRGQTLNIQRDQTSGLTPNVPQPGDRVQITSGPFKGLEAIYDQPNGEMRSMVFINLLHQQTHATLNNTQIQGV